MNEAQARETSDTTTLELDLKTAPVPRDIETQWQKLMEGAANLATKRAIYRAVILGQSWREAAEEEGLRLNVPWKTARRYGLAGRNQQQITQSLSRLVTLSADRLEKDLLEEDNDLSTKDVAVVMGIASDKLSRAWEKRREESNYVSLLDRLAQKLEQGGTVRFEMTVTPNDSAIDVTPANASSSPEQSFSEP